MASQSFEDLLHNYGSTYPPALPVPADGDIRTWRHELIFRIRELLGDVLSRVALTVKTIQTTVCQGHVRHDLRIAVNALTSLPAYLLVPDNLVEGEKRPAIIALHGHTKFGRDTIAGLDNPHTRSEPALATGLDAVRAGYVALVPAWWGFPGRDAHAERIPKGSEPCNVIQVAASMYGLNVLALHLQDAEAAVDFLSQRPEVDASRIGCMGNSLGGRMAMWLAAMDQRIAATVASGCMNTFRERSLKLRSCAVQCPVGMLRYGDVQEVFSTIAPRPLQLMTGSADKLMMAADVTMIHQTVRHAYHALDAQNNLDFAVHPGGHCLVWELASPFLEKHLGPIR